MRRLVFVFALLAASASAAQDRSAELERAHAEIVAAFNALKEAEQRREKGVEPLPGERLGTASGKSRLSDGYFARQKALDAQVQAARARLDRALVRRNELR
jgi:hypothetical protein